MNAKKANKVSIDEENYQELFNISVKTDAPITRLVNRIIKKWLDSIQVEVGVKTGVSNCYDRPKNAPKTP